MAIRRYKPTSPGRRNMATSAFDDITGLPLLMLPEGFRYLSFGWTGDPMIDGTPTPGAHDGMAALYWRGQRVRLVRNHELSTGTPFAAVAYDSASAGGTTTIEFDQKTGEYVGTAASLSGTVRNCAGGPTLWGSWLTGEETTAFTTATGPPHGYVFDEPADGTGDPLNRCATWAASLTRPWPSTT